MTSFSQSIQAWKLRTEEDQRRYAAKFEIDAVKKDLTKNVGRDLNDMIDLNADRNVDVEDTLIDIKIVKVAEESSKILPIRKKMRGLLPHRLTLKERMKDRTISDVDLLHPNPLPKMDPRRKPRASTRLA